MKKTYFAILAAFMMLLIPCVALADNSGFGLPINRTPEQIRKAYNSYISKALSQPFAIGTFQIDKPVIAGKSRRAYIGSGANDSMTLFVFADNADKTTLINFTMPFPTSESDFQIMMRCYLGIINVLNPGIGTSLANQKLNAMLNAFDPGAPQETIVRINNIEYDMTYHDDKSSAAMAAKKFK